MSEVANFFSGLFNAGASAFSGVVNIGSNIANGVANVVDAVKNIGQDILKTLASIPQDIVNIFTGLGVALVHGAQTIGAWFFSAWHEFSGAIMGLANLIKNSIINVAESILHGAVAFGNALHGIGEWIWHGIVDGASKIEGAFIAFANIVVNFFKTLWNDLVNIWNQYIKPIFDKIGGVIFGLPSLFMDTVGKLLNLPSQLADIGVLPANMLKQEVTRLGVAMPRVIGYNLAIEGLYRAIKSAKKPTDYFIKPLFGVLAGLIAEAIVAGAYPDITTSQTYTHNLSKTPATPTVPTTTQSTPTTTQITAEAVSPTTLTKPSVTPPPSGVLVHPNILPVTVVDVLTFESKYALAVGGGINLEQNIQTFEDTTGISATLYARLLSVIQSLVEDDVQPYPIASVVTQKAPFSDTATFTPIFSATAFILPPGWSICSQYTVPQTTVSGSITASDTITAYYAECIPFQNLITDEAMVYTTWFNQFTGTANDEAQVYTKWFNQFTGTVSDEAVVYTKWFNQFKGNVIDEAVVYTQWISSPSTVNLNISVADSTTITVTGGSLK